MRNLFTTIKENNIYYLHYKGVCYAYVTKAETCWKYRDSDKEYYFNTLTDAKNHFTFINWDNCIKIPFNISTFTFAR